MGPLLPLAAGWTTGLLAAVGLSPGPWQAPCGLIALAIGVGLAVWGLWVGRRGEPSSPAPRWLAPALALPGLLAGAAASVSAAPGPLPPDGLVRVVGQVVDTRHLRDDQARSIVRVIRGARVADGTPVDPGTLLLAGPHALPEGGRVRLVGKLRPSVPFRNPSPHPALPPRYPIAGRLWLPDPGAAELLSQSPLAGVLSRARDHVREALIATLTEPSVGIARAVVLGEGGAVDEARAASVREAGLAHVLAVSGLHVALLAGVLVGLMRRALLITPLARRYDVERIACALGVPIAFAHAAFAGAGPSAMRAAATAGLAWMSVAAGLRPRPGAVIALAALLLGALEPAEAARPGALLSIAATAAIVSARLGPPTTLLQWVRAALSISVRTTLATAPIILWCFGQLPLFGVAANVVIVPLATGLLVPLAAAHALTASFAIEPSAATAALLEPVARAFLAACELFARLAPDLAWPVPDLWQGATLVFLSAGLLCCRRTRAKVMIGAVALVAMAGLELRLRNAERPVGELRVSFLDVGQGDAALVDLPDGRAMLIDGGGNPSGGVDPGRAVLAPLLAARRRTHLDVVVLSHPHPDHYGGLGAVLEHASIGELWDSGQAAAERDLSPTAAEAEQLIDRARASGTRVRTPSSLCGEPLRAGGATVRVLGPCPAYDSGYDANDNSIVLRVDFGRTSVLFTGDAEAHAESMLLTRGAPLAADVLKVGHHGSRTSTTDAFLRAVGPHLAVISAGAVNPFGHPHAQVLARLRAVVPRTLQLAESGGSILRSDGRHWHLHTWRGEETTVEPVR